MQRSSDRRRYPSAILVVDDDPQTAEIVRTWFYDDGFEVIDADDGPSGFELAVARRPGIVLLDIKMPGESGLSIARRLKSHPATRAIPVVLLTACRDTESKVEAFSTGADDYVTKPFVMEEFDARVRSLLRRGELLTGLESRVRYLSTENAELERLLTLDEKTGLHNFREFRRRLHEEWMRAERYGAPLSLVLIDVDDFKRMNDTLGHQAGDRILQEFATLVVGGARATDVAARYGGEEFAVILPHTEAKMASRVAGRIREATAEFVFLHDEAPSRMTVSIGVASYPESRGVDGIDALVRVADEALYRAKETGKNRVVVADGRGAAQRREVLKRAHRIRTARRTTSSA